MTLTELQKNALTAYQEYCQFAQNISGAFAEWEGCDGGIDTLIATKVNEVFCSLQNAIEQVVAMESSRGTDALSQAVATAVPDYDKVNFLDELRANYEKFDSYWQLYCQKGIFSSKHTLEVLAQCFVNVQDIHTNIQQLTQTLSFDEEGPQDISSLRAMVTAQNQSQLDALAKKALKPIKEFAKAAKDAAQQTNCLASISLPGEHNTCPTVGISLGLLKGSDPVRFGDLHAAVKLPAEPRFLLLSSLAGNMAITYKPSQEDDAFNITQNLLQRFSTCYPRRLIKALGLHNKLGSPLTRIFDAVFDGHEQCKMSPKVPFTETQSGGIKKAILRLECVYEDRKSQLGTTDVFRFNCENPGEALPLIMVVVKDYPRGLEEDIAATLADIAKNGNKYGIFFLVLRESKETNALTANCQVWFDIRKGSLILNDQVVDTSFSCDVPPDLAEGLQRAAFAEQYNITK